MFAPQAQQKCATPGPVAPQRLQYRAGPGAARIGTRTSAVQAQIKATIQPITVQPSKKFSRKMPANGRLLWPTIEGRKYITPQKTMKNMLALLSRAVSGEPALHRSGF